MSGWGTAVFELGLVGIFFILAFMNVMRRGWKVADDEMKRVVISSSVTIYFVMLMAVPIAFPLFGYMVGVFVHLQTAADPAVIPAEQNGAS